MAVKISTKLVRNLTGEEIRQCKALTLREGQLRPQLAECLTTKGDPQDRVFMARQDDGRLVGWGLVHHHIYVQPSTQPRLAHWQVYVTREFRRRGVGSRLTAAAHKRFGVVSVRGWDKCSNSFFQTQGELVKKA